MLRFNGLIQLVPIKTVEEEALEAYIGWLTNSPKQTKANRLGCTIAELDTVPQEKFDKIVASFTRGLQAERTIEKYLVETGYIVTYNEQQAQQATNYWDLEVVEPSTGLKLKVDVKTIRNPTVSWSKFSKISSMFMCNDQTAHLLATRMTDTHLVPVLLINLTTLRELLVVSKQEKLYTEYRGIEMQTVLNENRMLRNIKVFLPNTSVKAKQFEGKGQWSYS